MKTTMDLKSAKLCEEAAVREALHAVYTKYGRLPPKELSYDIASYVIQLRNGLHDKDPFLWQDLCLALFCGGEVFSALRLAVSSLPQASSIEELLTTLRSCAKHQMHRTIPKQTEESVLDLSESLKSKFFNLLGYIFERVRFSWSAFVSTALGDLLFGNIWPFDPRCFAKNFGGRLMVEEIIRSRGSAYTMLWLIGATPTVADRIARETRLAIQALENPASVFSYGLWIYCNLQGTQLISEKKRSNELLKLSYGKIDHFRLASISVDNPLYLAQSSRSDDLGMHRAFIERELEAAIAGKQSWFAFALKEEERADWRACTQYVLNQACTIAKECQEECSAVFHELVVLGLVRAWQAFCSKNSTKDVLSTIACKEGADRGGHVNAALAWALLQKGEPEPIQDVEAILWGRPLLARARLNEHYRTRNFLSLVRALSRDKVRAYLEEVFSNACNDRFLSYAICAEGSC